MMLDVVTSKGEAIRSYVENGDGDGGMVVCYLKEVEPGVYAARREWFSDPAQAKAEYAAIDAAKAEAKDPTVKGVEPAIRV